MWKFTRHVEIRMAERNVSRDNIAAVLNGDVPAIIYQSPRDKDVSLYFAAINSKFIMIPVDNKTRSIITVRPMSKKEKTQFLKEIKDE